MNLQGLSKTILQTRRAAFDALQCSFEAIGREEELDKLPSGIHDRIIGRVLSLRDTPRPARARKLVGREGYRLRVGEHRILYEVDDPKQQVEVFSIAHRKEVYRR